MAAGGVLGQCEEDLGPQPELTQEGHLESILLFFLQIMGDKTGQEWDNACSRSHSKSVMKLKLVSGSQL